MSINLESGVKKVFDVFDPRAFKFIDEESCSKLDSKDTSYQVNKSNWTGYDAYISNYGQAGTIITTAVSDDVQNLLLAAIHKQVEFKFETEKVRFRHTYMFRGAFIPWHCDNHCDLAFTFYLQDSRSNDGGLYLYTDDSPHPGHSSRDDPLSGMKDVKLHGILPEKNTMLLQHNVWHSVSALQPMTPVRRTIQAFMSF